MFIGTHIVVATRARQALAPVAGFPRHASSVIGADNTRPSARPCHFIGAGLSSPAPMESGTAPKPPSAPRRSLLRRLMPPLLGFGLAGVVYWLRPAAPAKVPAEWQPLLRWLDDANYYITIFALLAIILGLPRIARRFAREAVPAKRSDLWGYLFLLLATGCIIYFGMEMIGGW